MITQDSFRLFILAWVDRIVFSQLYFVCGMGVLTIGLMLFRRQKEARLARLKNFYADQFINELLSQADGQHEIFLIRPSALSWLSTQALHETLLAQINSLSGSERQYAVQRYIELNFSKDDINDCTSLLWWKRLEGVSHLNALKTDSFGRVFNYMRKDPNPLISLYALLGLSALHHKFNNVELFETLDERVQGQDNILLEITRNWSGIFGLSPLIEYINTTSSFEFRNTFVTAICQLKTPESAQVIAGFLQENSRFFPPDLISEMIHVMREIGDPSVGNAIKQYLKHENELVRQRALEFVIEVESEIPPDLIEEIAQDPSPGVRRIYDEWILKGKAA